MGTIDFRNWEPTCLAGESDTVVPDPKDGNLLYGSGDQRCNQAMNLPEPAGGKLPAEDPADPNRRTWTLPQVFSPADDALYYANQFVFRMANPNFLRRFETRTTEPLQPFIVALRGGIGIDVADAVEKRVERACGDNARVKLGAAKLAAADAVG